MGKALKMPGGVSHVLLPDAVHRTGMRFLTVEFPQVWKYVYGDHMFTLLPSQGWGPKYGWVAFLCHQACIKRKITK